MKDPFFALRLGSFECICGFTTEDEASLEIHDGGDGEEDLHPLPRRMEMPPVKRLPSRGAIDLARRGNSRRLTLSNDGVSSQISLNSLPIQEEDLEALNELTPEKVEEVRAYNLAESRGQFISARREQQRLQAAGVDPEHIFKQQSLERVRRVCTTYEESMKILQGRFKDMDTSEKMDCYNCEWGLTVKGDALTMLYSVEEPELDLISAVAALMERDLQKAFNQGIVRTERLGTSSSNEQFWRTWTYSRTAKAYSDNIQIINSMDALDEPVAAVWGSYATPSTEAATAQGVYLPPADPGCARTEHAFTVWQLVPMHDQGHRHRSLGFRMRMQMDVKLPAVIATAVNLLPWFAVRRLARNRVSKAVKEFHEFVRTSEELKERVQTSAHKRFYSWLKERLSA